MIPLQRIEFYTPSDGMGRPSGPESFMLSTVYVDPRRVVFVMQGAFKRCDFDRWCTLRLSDGTTIDVGGKAEDVAASLSHDEDRAGRRWEAKPWT